MIDTMTQTAKHTPGPWTVEREPGLYGVYQIEEAAKRERCGDMATDEPKANARLIAVAPEMLSLLKRINEAFYVKGTRKALTAVMAETKPLIAKAEARPNFARFSG